MKKLFLTVFFLSLLAGSCLTRAVDTSGMIINSAITLAFATAFANLSSSEDLPKSLAYMTGGFLLTHPLISSRFNGKKVGLGSQRFSAQAESNSAVNVDISLNGKNSSSGNELSKHDYTSMQASNNWNFNFDTSWRSALFFGGIYALGVGCKLLGNYARGYGSL